MKRYAGIDLMRILAMLYVIILHILGQGGLIDNIHADGASAFRFLWLMETWCYCAVDLFAIITGFVYYSNKEREFHISNYLIIWLQVVAYSVAIYLLYKIKSPELVENLDWWEMCFPVSNNLYWYFTAFTGLFFMVPLFSAGIRHMSNSFCIKLFFIIMLLFCAYENCVAVFDIYKGYNVTWLFMLCIMGMLAKKCELWKLIRIRYAVLTIIFFSLFSWYYAFHGKPFTLASHFNDSFCFIQYTSPTIVMIALAYLCIGMRLDLPDKFGQRISFISKNVFAAYLINTHPLIWEYGMQNRFVSWLSDPIAITVLKVLTTAMLFLTVSVGIDVCRSYFFQLVRIPQLTKRIDRLINK